MLYTESDRSLIQKQLLRRLLIMLLLALVLLINLLSAKAAKLMVKGRG